MTLAERIKLIDQMIRENPDYTIKDYLELVKDIEVIEEARDTVIPVLVTRNQNGVSKDWKNNHCKIQINKRLESGPNI